MKGRYGVVVALALVAVACGGSSPSSPATNQPVKLTIADYGGGSRAAEKGAWIDPFTAADPNITFDYGLIDYSKLITQVQS